jgi:tetratricopeptide (TPR) repeat protein
MAETQAADGGNEQPAGVVFQQRYRLEGTLGQGGMGVVHKAHDLLLDRPVAVKFLGSSEADGRERLLREAQATAKLNHPNIVAVYDAGEAELPGRAGRRPYIVLELVEGQSLHEQPPTALDEIVAIARQICAALAQAHAHGLIHRDLKPENVMLAADGTAKLMDFGMARAVASRLTAEGGALGTVFYLAPELALGQAFDERVDLYALGVMLYELTTGRLPFVADDPVAVISQHLYAPIVPPSTYNPALPPALDELIVRLMSKAPTDRPASAEAVLAALSQPGLLAAAPESAPAGPAAKLAVLDRIVRGRLVGRRPEVQQLLALWGQARQGRGHLALISGEPGIGKTRLARELLVHARLDGALALTGGCYEHEAAVPYLPFVEGLRGWAEAQTDEALRSRLGPAAGPGWTVTRLLPALEARLGPLPASAPLPPSEERLRLFESLARLFQDLAAPNGLLVVIDDLHWADQGTLALLHYLVRRLREARVLFVALYREVELDRKHPLAAALVEWNRERAATRVTLGRLSADDTGALLAALFGVERVSPEFTAAIYRETEGNPFFTEEVIKFLVEQGDVYRVEATWDRKAIEELAVPQSIREAIGRRLDRLSPGCVAVLHVAATLGKDFAFAELAAAAGMAEEALLDALDEADAAQLIRAEAGEAFVFTHDKIREVLYEELNPIRRRRLHQQVVAGLERLYASPAAREAHVPDLAHHAMEAGDLARGLDYALQAAAQARRLFALDEALDHYRGAAEMAAELGRAEQAAAIELEMGDVHAQRGVYHGAVEHYQRVLKAAEGAQRAAVTVRIGMAYTQIGDARALEYLRQAESELDPETQANELANALSALGRFHHYRGQHRKAIEFQERARRLVEGSDDSGTLTLIYTHLAGSYQHLAEYAQSNDWAGKALALGERMGQPWAMTLGYEFLAENATAQGRWADALRYAALDRELGEKIGALDRLAWSDFARAWACHGTGDLPAGLEAARRGQQLAEQIGEGRLAALMTAVRALVESDLGTVTPEEAAAAGRRAMQQADALGQVYVQCMARHGVAYGHLRRGEWAEAAALYAECEALYAPTENRLSPLVMGPAPALARLGLGAVEVAAELAETYLRLAQAAEAPHWEGYARRAQGQILAAQGRVEEAARALEDAIGLLAPCGSRLELGRAYYQRALLLTGQGERERAGADLSAARELFEACGAARDLRRVTDDDRRDRGALIPEG